MTEETKALKEDIKAIAKETEKGRAQLKEAVERLAAQIDECAKSQEELKESIRELEAAIAAEDGGLFGCESNGER